MFGPPRSSAPRTARTTPDLERAKSTLRDELTRADRAIQAAMGHADEIFGPSAYRGPDRRRMRR